MPYNASNKNGPKDRRYIIKGFGPGTVPCQYLASTIAGSNQNPASIIGIINLASFL